MEKKKIGIMTYHRSINYGAELQAFALMSFLKMQNYNASIIDYWPNYRTDDWDRIKKSSLFEKIRLTELKIAGLYRNSQRRKKTEAFISEYMHLTPVNEKYGIVLYGSDQIWRKFNRPDFKGYDAAYWGDDTISTDFRIAYAASMGNVNINKKEDVQFVERHLKRFDAVSVREQDLVDFFHNQYGLNIKRVLDPVFLLSTTEWNTLLPDKNVPKYKYVLYYKLQKNNKADEMSLRLQKEKGLKVIEMRSFIPEFHYGCRYRFTADAREFLSLLRNAEYVISSSFHGVALSIRFNKDFFYWGNSTSANRISSLLSSLGLKERMNPNVYEISLDKNIFWDDINTKLETLERDSKEWLMTQINKCE